MGLRVMKSVSWIFLLFVWLVGIWMGGCQTQEQKVERLIKQLWDQNLEVRRDSVWALGKIGSVDAVPALIQVLQDEGMDVRINAVEALENIGTPEALKAVEELEGN